MSARTADIPAIKAAVARAFGVGVAAIEGYGRWGEVARARQVAMWLTRKVTVHVGLTAIGTAFGRDHSTVLHALVRVERRLRDDSDFADRVETIRRHLDAGTLPPAPPRPPGKPARRVRVAHPLYGMNHTALLARGVPLAKDDESIRFRAAAASGADALLARLRARYPVGAP